MKYYRKPRTKKVFKQFSPPWGTKPYPSAPSTVASSGCGLCSVTHLAIEQSAKADYTPSTLYSYMKQYAVLGHGTEWVGIDNGMKHIGLTDVKRVGDLETMYQEMAKGNRVAVFLFNGNISPNGVQWTGGGHYCAAVAYKVGKYHYFYMKDSGGRNHDGWYSYEKSMKGCIKMMWVGKLPAEAITLPERGYFQYGDKSPDIKKIQKFLKAQGLYKGRCGGNYKRLTRKAVKKFQAEHGLAIDGLFGAECLKMYNKLA